MSEDADRRRESLQGKLKKAIEDIADGAKQASAGGGSGVSSENTNLTASDIINDPGKLTAQDADIISSVIDLEAEKKAEQLSIFLEKEVFEKIATLEGKIQALESQLAATATVTPGL